MKQLWIIALITALGIGPASCNSITDAKEKEPQPTTIQPVSPAQVRISVVGDIMMHSTQIDSGKNADGTYDYNDFFQEVKPYFDRCDLVIGNLETTFSGPDRGYFGYPMFRAPDALGQSLKKAGFDILSTANNHSMDGGEQGLVRTHKYLKEIGIQPVGSAPTPEEQEPLIMDKNGIKLSFSSYTYGTNGIPVPKKYLVNHIQMDQILSDIKKSKQKGAEFIAVMLHFGEEYQRKPNAEQQKIVQQVLDGGADIVLGGHPHVLQPMKRITSQDQEKFVVYSLGNFISDQIKPYTNDGMILYLDLKRNDKKSPVQIENVSYVPTYVHKYQNQGKKQFVVIPVENQEGTSHFPAYPALSREKLQQTWDNTTNLMKEYEDFPTFTLYNKQLEAPLSKG